MGDRAQVEFITEGKSIYFYTHWDASELENKVIKAMERGKERHNDPEYLSRIIFCEMVQKDDILKITGYGIGLYKYEDRVITVNCDTKKVTFFNGDVKEFDEFIVSEETDGN